MRDVGYGAGKYTSVNFPLNNGIDDLSYENIFKPIIAKIMDVYRPGAVVLQCGADSLAGDRLGCFNLSMEGHAKCVEYVKSFNLPLLILGGGGYTVKNVSRCWTYETSVLLNMPIKNELPFNDYITYFEPDFKLMIPHGSMENQNSYEYLQNTTNTILENLSKLKSAPSVQFQDVPPDAYLADESDDDDEEFQKEKKERYSTDRFRGIIKMAENDYYDDEYEDNDTSFSEL